MQTEAREEAQKKMSAPQLTKTEKKREADIAKYSRDYDMSMVIKWAFLLFGTLMVGLMVMEGFNRWMMGNTENIYLTPEIIHTIFGFIGGWCSSVVMYFFAKKLGENRTETPPATNEKEQ